jgi:hypothetical protein
MTTTDKLLPEILGALIFKKKSVSWVEEEYNLDASDILRAWVKMERKVYGEKDTHSREDSNFRQDLHN